MKLRIAKKVFMRELAGKGCPIRRTTFRRAKRLFYRTREGIECSKIIRVMLGMPPLKVIA